MAKENIDTVRRGILTLYQDEATSRVAAIHEAFNRKLPNTPEIYEELDIDINSLNDDIDILSTIGDRFSSMKDVGSMDMRDKDSLIETLGELQWRVLLIFLKLGIPPIVINRRLYDKALENFVSESRAKEIVGDDDNLDYKKVQGPLSETDNNLYYIINPKTGAIVNTEEYNKHHISSLGIF